MKLFLFLLIITLLGSLSKAPIQPCSKTLVTKYYYKGKFIRKVEFDKYSTLSYRDGILMTIKGTGGPFLADSLRIYMK